MAGADGDREDRRLDVDEPAESHLVAREDAAPGSAEGNAIFSHDAEVSRTRPAFEPRNDVSSRHGIGECGRAAWWEGGLHDHLREEWTIDAGSGPDPHDAIVADGPRRLANEIR